MDRKDFFKKTFSAGLVCCGAVSTLSALSIKDKNGIDKPQKWIGQLEEKMVAGSETPAWRKADKGEKWIKDLVDNMDELLDDNTKKELLQACGRSCYDGAFGIAPSEKPSYEAAEGYIKYFENNGYSVNREDKKTTIIYNWGRDHQNPWGLIISDGYCMCPLVENGPPDLSGTYCNCSSGYVKEIFKRGTGRKTKVDVIDSLKRGGKDCIFKVEIFEG